MGDMLSQAEIDALLNGASLMGSNNSELSSQEIDALGEIGNISMGTSATTLFALLGHKVVITTPKVTVTTWGEMVHRYAGHYVAVRVEYTMGLVGSNLLIMKDDDVRVITDLMMGGEGKNEGGELTDLHLSAISEAMNQMIGSAATSMSSMFNKRIDISPPKAFLINLDSTHPFGDFEKSEKVVNIAFKMEVGNLIDSEIMQIIPIDFAKNLVDNLLNIDIGASPIQEPPANTTPSKNNHAAGIVSQPKQPAYAQHPPMQQSFHQSGYDQSVGMGQMDYGNMHQDHSRNRTPINVQPAQFEAFDDGRISVEKKNIGIIMDVPLEVTVELGRTHKLIKEILEFGPGSIIELDKLAGEPVDILVNGKAIAKGEVVVIDESFGVRITDIIHPSKRL